MIGLGGRARAHQDLESLLVDVADLRPYPSNPRAADIETIAESIIVNGLYRPVYAQRSTGQILAGNHTYAAALSLGAERLPVVWLDVDDTQAKRILLIDNRSADLGTYENAVLLEHLQVLVEQDQGLLGTGYTPENIALLLAEIERDMSKDLDLSDFPMIDPELATTHTCPSCGYEWRGA